MRCAMLGALLCGLAWPVAPAQAKEPAVPSQATATSGSDQPATSARPSAAEREAMLWRELGEIQRAIPSGASARRPYASVNLGGNESDSRVIIHQQDDTGGSFKVARIIYALDGHVLARQSSASGLPAGLRIFDGRVFPGSHRLQVRVVMRGNDYGIFSYMKGYRIAHETSRAFRVPARGLTTLTVRIKERATDDMKRKFYIDVDLSRKPAAATSR